jgi:hypothetical protein
MKRVVAGVNAEGRSYFVSTEELDTTADPVIWEYDAGQVRDIIAAIDPEAAADWISPGTPGGVRWFCARMPPASAGEAPEMPGIDADGWHTTRTVDFDFVVDGEITLQLDEGSRDLVTGDVAILFAARHAWKNTSDTHTTLLSVIHRPHGV